MVKLSYIWMVSTSSGRTPARPKASGPHWAAAVVVKSGIWLIVQWVWAPAAPRT